MGMLIGSGLIAVCVVAAWLIIRRPLRQVFEEVHFDQARVLFRREREWLEARFVTAISRSDTAEGLRWDTAFWHDDIVWARDRDSRRLLALVCVHFDAPYDAIHDPGCATALFEFHGGRWHAEGRRLDLTRPDQAVGRDQPFEAIIDVPSARRLIP